MLTVGLFLVEIRSQDIGALSVGLTPLLGLCVVELKTKNTFTELVHDVCPQHSVNFLRLPAEERVHIGQLAQIETASVGSALLV